MPSITNGVVVERRRYIPRVSYALRSSLDGVSYVADGSVVVDGWVVDPHLAGGGVPPVSVKLVITSAGAPPQNVTVVANVNRPDLVKNHPPVAPNPDHGFHWVLPKIHRNSAAVDDDELSHPAVPMPTLKVHAFAEVARGGAVGVPTGLVELSGSPKCLCGKVVCLCTPVLLA